MVEARPYALIAQNYAREVVAKKIPACRSIRLQCQRFLDELKVERRKAFSQANRIDFQILHGNAADGSDLTPVADTDILFDGLAPLPFTNGIVRSLVAAKPAADIQKVGYVGGKRYVKVIADFGGPHNTGTPIAVSVVRGRAALRGAA